MTPQTALQAAHQFALDAASSTIEEEQYHEAEHTEPLLLRNLLTENVQMDDIIREASADGVWPKGVAAPAPRTAPGSVDNKNDGADTTENKRASVSAAATAAGGLLLDLPHHYAWTDAHAVLYMHNQDHWFVRTLPLIWSILRGGMESRPWMNGAIPVLEYNHDDAAAAVQHVRTIELHHYTPGGGLTTPGHRDCGSEWTLSVLLSDPSDVHGGDFVTYEDTTTTAAAGGGSGCAPVAHVMARGDAILFRSEKLHNISTVTSGLRKSLVVELWPTSKR